ncbi:hypothetical protein [Enterobacter asburiae]|jgi:hypothetical protein|uniref:hypothetical protein n=1 Tax=Enterobacter asburiae TaxID=61645 RepID=UPI00192BCD2E|nr:hypothetical protein [Enterobacter asburiae]MBL5912182.1 hypothetical protein [Enterobacter asburiae]
MSSIMPTAGGRGFVRLNACGHCSAGLIKLPAATAFIFSLLSGGFRFYLDITPFIAGAESSPQDEPD